MPVSGIRKSMAVHPSSDTVIIRKYRKEDFDDVCSLEQLGVTDHYQASVFIRQISELFSATFYVACASNRPIAYIIGAKTPDNPAKAWILRLMVDEAYRRQSIGKCLLEHNLSELRIRGVKEVFLSVSPEHTAALNLYRIFGFQEVNFVLEYFGKDEDRLILKKTLSD